MSGPAYVIRAATAGDLDAFKVLREEAGPGFTSLMLDDRALLQKLEHAQESFQSTATGPGTERYLLVLEHIATGDIAGCCGVKSTIGASPPFFNFRVLRVAQASAAAERRFDMDVLILVNEFTGCSEVGNTLRARRAPGRRRRAFAGAIALSLDGRDA